MEWIARTLTAGLLGLGAPAAAAELILDDPLTSAAQVDERVGGSFSAEGWTRDSWSSKLIYDLGRDVTQGRLQFEMRGVNGIDHGVGGNPPCRAIFAALDSTGSGNLGNQNIWVWAMDSTEICNGSSSGPPRTHRMKMLLRMLQEPEPGEPMSEELSWNEDRFYTYEVTWNHERAVLKRDGVVVLDRAYPATPRSMHMRYLFLGTIKRYNAGVGGATYRNLELWDTGDGGPPPGPDGGPPGGDAGPSNPTLEFESIADTHVISTDPTGNFGTATQMCSAMGSPWWYVSFMRFSVGSVPGAITRATLHLSASNTGYGGKIFPMVDDGWDELGVTFDSMPGFDSGTVIDSRAHVNSGDAVTFDLTGFITAGAHNAFVIANDVQGDGCCYRTREAAPFERPLLVIEYDPGLPTGGDTDVPGPGGDDASTNGDYAFGGGDYGGGDFVGGDPRGFGPSGPGSSSSSGHRPPGLSFEDAGGCAATGAAFPAAMALLLLALFMSSRRSTTGEKTRARGRSTGGFRTRRSRLRTRDEHRRVARAALDRWADLRSPPGERR